MNSRHLTFILALFALTVATSCAPEPLTRDDFNDNSSADAGENNTMPGMDMMMSTNNNTATGFDAIVQDMRDGGCFSCHGPTAGAFGNFGAGGAEPLNPTNDEVYAALLDVDSTVDGKKIVTPNDSVESSLYFCLDGAESPNSCSQVMGTGTNGMIDPDSFPAKVAAWIDAGATR